MHTLSIILSLTSAVVVAPLRAVTYYVDATYGSDANSGSSTTGPWRTIAKVNSTVFKAGDEILFKRGDLWRDRLAVSSSGSAQAPLVIGAYGTGAKPKLRGSNVLKGWADDTAIQLQSSTTTSTAPLLRVDAETSGTSPATRATDGNSITPTAEAARTGSFGYRVNYAGTSGVAGATAAFSPQDDVYARMHVRLGSTLTMKQTWAPFEIFTLLNGTGMRLAMFTLYPVDTNTIGYRFDTWNPYTGVTAVTTSSFARNRWYSIEMRWKRGVSNGGAEIWIDGVSKGSTYSLNTDSQRAANIRIGSTGEWNWPSSGFVDVDDVGVATAPLATYQNLSTTTTSPTTTSGTDVFSFAGLFQEPHILLRNGVTMRRVSTVGSLVNLSWTWANGRLYFRDGAGNPDRIGTLIEAGIRNAVVEIIAKQYVAIRELDIAHADQAGILVKGGTSYCEVSDNELHHNANNGYKSGVALVGASNCRVQRNTIFENDGDGISLSGYGGANTSYNVVTENIVFRNNLTWDDAGGINLWLAGPGNMITNNRSYENGTAKTRASGIMIDELSGPTVAARNICWGNSNGGILLAGRGHVIAHNTLYRNNQGTYDSGEINLFTTPLDSSSGSVVQNNIAVAAPGKEVVHTSAGAIFGHVFSNNLYMGDVWNWNGNRVTLAQWQAAARDYSRVADPLLLNPVIRDFRLTALSPAIDSGRVIVNIGQAYLGTAPDIGGHEFVP